MADARVTDNYLAGRLIQYALRIEESPTRTPEYQQLLNRFLDDATYQTLVRETADGLGLLILDVSERGLVVAPAADSVFALNPSDFHPSRGSTDERLIDGLIQVAIAATVFPRARDLEQDASFVRPPVTADEVDRTMRAICDAYAEKARNAPDLEVAAAEQGLYEAWRVYHTRASVAQTAGGRGGRHTTRRQIERNLERLCTFGAFFREQVQGADTYQPTYRYQVLVKESAAERVLEALRVVQSAEEAEDEAKEGT